MPLIQTYGGDSVRAYGDFTKNIVLATGGDIISYYNGYIYHTFLNNGSFKLKTAKNSDILVVGGGGGGGGVALLLSGSYGGGGGAVQYFSNQSLSTTSYNITVGNGGSGGSFFGASGTNGSSSQFGSLTASSGGGFGQSLGGTNTFTGSSYSNTAASSGGNGGGGNPGASGTQGFSGNIAGGGGAGGNATATTPGVGALYQDFAIASGLSSDGRFGGGGGSSPFILTSGGGGPGGGPLPYGSTLTNQYAYNGKDGLGGGGGVWGEQIHSGSGSGAGGKGVVIVRYPALYSGQTVKVTPGSVPTNSAIPTFEWGGGNLGPGFQIRKSSDGTWNNADSFEYKWQYSNDNSIWGDRTLWSSTYAHFLLSSSTDLEQPWQYFTTYPNKTMASNSNPQNLAGSSDQGLYYRLAVRAKNSNGYSDPAYSLASNQIPLIPIYYGGATKSGSVTAGSTVTVNSIGSWSRSSQSGYYYYQFALLQGSSFETNPSSIQTGVSDVNGNLAIGWSRGNSFYIPTYYAGFGINLGCYITPYQDNVTGLSSLNTATGAFLYLGRVP